MLCGCVMCLALYKLSAWDCVMCIESCYILTHNINVLLLVNRSYNFNCSVQSIFKPAVLVIIVDTASIVCGAGSMKLSSVRLSVCPIIWPPHAAAAGLLHWARRPGDIDRLLHGRRPAANASSVSLSVDTDLFLLVLLHELSSLITTFCAIQMCLLLLLCCQGAETNVVLFMVYVWREGGGLVAEWLAWLDSGAEGPLSNFSHDAVMQQS